MLIWHPFRPTQDKHKAVRSKLRDMYGTTVEQCGHGRKNWRNIEGPQHLGLKVVGDRHRFGHIGATLTVVPEAWITSPRQLAAYNISDAAEGAVSGDERGLLRQIDGLQHFRVRRLFLLPLAAAHAIRRELPDPIFGKLVSVAEIWSVPSNDIESVAAGVGPNGLVRQRHRPMVCLGGCPDFDCGCEPRFGDVDRESRVHGIRANSRYAVRFLGYFAAVNVYIMPEDYCCDVRNGKIPRVSNWITGANIESCSMCGIVYLPRE